MDGAVVTGELHRASLGREVAVQDRDAATCLERRLDRDDDRLTLGLDGGVGDLAERAPVDRPSILVQQPGLLELAGDERDPARLEHVVRVPAAPRLHVGDDRCLRRDALEVVDREVDPEVAGDRDEVQHAVRRAACRGDAADGVLERLPRDERARRHVVLDELHGELADLVGGLLLRLVHRRDPVHADRREAEEVEDPRHRVRGELTAAGTGSRAGGRFELVEVGVGDLPRGVRADSLVDVGDRHLAAAIEARCDRARVVDDRGNVEAADGHRGAGVGLVAGDEAHEPVEEMSAGDELDRVGDHLTGDERRAHPRRSHRDAVRDGDGVELHRRAAGVADAALHVHREVALVQVARHRLDPGRADPDDRLREILVGETGRLEHRPRACAIRPVGHRRALPLGGVRRCVVRRAHCDELLSMGCPSRRHHSLNDPGYILASSRPESTSLCTTTAAVTPGAAVRRDLAGRGHPVGKRLGERRVERAGDPTGDGVERLDLAAPTLGCTGVEQDERRVVEAGEDLIGVDRVVRALSGGEGGGLARPSARARAARDRRGGRACRRHRGRRDGAATSNAPPSRSRRPGRARRSTRRFRRYRRSQPAGSAGQRVAAAVRRVRAGLAQRGLGVEVHRAGDVALSRTPRPGGSRRGASS